MIMHMKKIQLERENSVRGNNFVQLPWW